MPWWLWLTVRLGLFLGDLLIPGGLVLCFFGAGALAVRLVVALALIQDAWVEWLLFSGFSIVALLVFRPSLVRYVRRSDPSLSLDSLVGESAVAQEDIAVDGLGRAELRGTTWTVRKVGTVPLTRGQRSLVTHVEGLTLWVRGV
jgi:inner membrane protein